MLVQLFDNYFAKLEVNPSFAVAEKFDWFYKFKTSKFLNAKNEIIFNDKLVGYLFNFDAKTTDDILNEIGKRTLLKELGKKPISIFGLYVLENTDFPHHLDVNSNRTTMVYNVMLSGKNSKTTLYVDNNVVFEFRGIKDYHFNPNLIVHSAKTSDEPIRLLQFFY